MSNSKLTINAGSSKIPSHSTINGLIDLLTTAQDLELVVAHSPEYVLLTDTDSKVFYRFDKTENGYLLTMSEND